MASDELRVLGWAADQFGRSAADLLLTLIAGDASPRRYYRLTAASTQPSLVLKTNQQFMDSCIVMVSPPSENNDAFLHVGARLSAAGQQTPTVWASSLRDGWFLLEDFGDRQLLAVLSPDSAPQLYRAALGALAKQCLMPCRQAGIPNYDAARLQQELDLFPEWFFSGLLGGEVKPAITDRFHALSQHLIDAALSQPAVWVHRDFHSRNLMVLDDGALGVIDFQDAVIGPITYDPVSLLKDCYVRWSRQQQVAWLSEYLETLKALPDHHALAWVDEVSQLSYSKEHDGAARSGSVDRHASRVAELSQQLADVTHEQFCLWFDLMGLQRHLKVLGIFARLHLRDRKSGYLDDLPLVAEYVREALRLTAGSHPSLDTFGGWFETEVMPMVRQQPWYRPVDQEGWAK